MLALAEYMPWGNHVATRNALAKVPPRRMSLEPIPRTILALSRKDASPASSAGSGMSAFYGYLHDLEHNADLEGPKWYGEFGAAGIADKMLRDADVRMSLGYVFNPLLAATWRYKPASKTPIDIEIADFCTWALTERLAWAMIVRMLVRDYGARGFALREWTDDLLPVPRERFPLHPGGGVGILPTGLHQVPANTVYRWFQDAKDTQKLAKITQWLPGSDVEAPGTRDLPMDRIARWSFEQDGAYFPGLSILRTAYPAWKAKIAFLTIRAIKHQRRGVGMPVAIAGERATDAELDAAEETLQHMQTHAQAYGILPSGWQMNWEGGTVSDGTNIDAAIAACSIEIAVNVACGFQMLGLTGKTGAGYGVGETQQGQYHVAEVGHAKFVADGFTVGYDNFSPTRRMVDVNYGKQYATPRLQALYLPTRNWSEVIKGLVSLVQQRVITPDEPLEDETREMLELGPHDPTSERPALSVVSNNNVPPRQDMPMDQGNGGSDTNGPGGGKAKDGDGGGQ